MKRVHVIDSHTGGEPTRLVMKGFPEPAGDTLAEQRDSLCERHDHWLRAFLTADSTLLIDEQDPFAWGI